MNPKAAAIDADALFAGYLILEYYEHTLPSAAMKPPFLAQVLLSGPSYRLTVAGINYRVAFAIAYGPGKAVCIVQEDDLIVVFRKTRHLDCKNGSYLERMWILAAIAHKRTTTLEKRRKFFIANSGMLFEEDPFQNEDRRPAKLVALDEFFRELDWPVPLSPQPSNSSLLQVWEN